MTINVLYIKLDLTKKRESKMNNSARDAKLKYEGKIFKSNNFGDFKVIEYIDFKNVVIEFVETKFVTVTTTQQIRFGEVRDLLYPSVEGIGINDLEFTETHMQPRHPYYYMWVNMLRRSHNVYSTYAYAGASCDKNWIYFSKFIEDISNIENHIKGVEDSWQLDKDILVKGNKHYSKETCCFVPKEINSLLVSARQRRGKLPVGVGYNKRDKLFTSTVSIEGKRKSLGCYKDEISAFQAYKLAKEQHIKYIADKFKDEIASNVYEALYNWEIEVDG